MQKYGHNYFFLPLMPVVLIFFIILIFYINQNIKNKTTYLFTFWLHLLVSLPLTIVLWITTWWTVFHCHLNRFYSLLVTLGYNIPVAIISPENFSLRFLLCTGQASGKRILNEGRQMLLRPPSPESPCSRRRFVLFIRLYVTCHVVSRRVKRKHGRTSRHVLIRRKQSSLTGDGRKSLGTSY